MPAVAPQAVSWCHQAAFLMLGSRRHFLGYCVTSVAEKPFLLTDAVSLVLGQLKTRSTLAGDTAPWGFLADVTTAVILIHATQALCKTAACSR